MLKRIKFIKKILVTFIKSITQEIKWHFNKLFAIRKDEPYQRVEIKTTTSTPVNSFWKELEDVDIVREEKALYLNADKYPKDKESLLKLCSKLLEKEPLVEVFNIKYFDSEKKYGFLTLLKKLMYQFPNLKQLRYFYEEYSSGYDVYRYADFITIEQPKRNTFIITEFVDSSFEKEYELPDFLERCTTLKTLRIPHLKSLDMINYLLDNNPNIETFRCLWDVASPEILIRSFKTFESSDRKNYRIQYRTLEQEFKGMVDTKKYALFRLFLTKKEIPFKPKRETLLRLMLSSVKVVQKNALRTFTRDWSADIASLDGLNITMVTKSKVYNEKEIAKLFKEVQSTLVTFESKEKIELLVVGDNETVSYNYQTDIPMISITVFDALLKRIDSKGDILKVKNYAILELVKEFDETSIVDLKNIKTNMSPKIVAILLGIAKGHPDAKTREEALAVIKKHGEKVSEKILKICEKKRYSSMTREKNLEADFNKMEKVEGFDLDTFAKALAWYHPKSFGKYRFIEADTDEVEAFILKKLNHRELTLTKGLSPRFVKATNVQHLIFDSKGGRITITKEITNLRELKYLDIYAKTIEIESMRVDSIKTLNIRECSHLTFSEDTIFSNVKRLSIFWVNDDFKVNAHDLKRIFPNLTRVQMDTKQHKNLRKEISKAFDNIRFIGLF